MIRVTLADDQEMVRVGRCASPNTRQRGRPDGHLDPGIDGVEAIRRIQRTRPPEDLRIIILTTYDHDQNVLNGLRAGANSSLSKGVGPAELAAAIHEVAAGGGSLSAAAAAILIETVAEAPAIPIDADLTRRFGHLTLRETEIVTALLASPPEPARRHPGRTTSDGSPSQVPGRAERQSADPADRPGSTRRSR